MLQFKHYCEQQLHTSHYSKQSSITDWHEATFADCSFPHLHNKHPLSGQSQLGSWFTLTVISMNTHDWWRNAGRREPTLRVHVCTLCSSHSSIPLPLPLWRKEHAAVWSAKQRHLGSVCWDVGSEQRLVQSRLIHAVWRHFDSTFRFLVKTATSSSEVCWFAVVLAWAASILSFIHLLNPESRAVKWSLSQQGDTLAELPVHCRDTWRQRTTPISHPWIIHIQYKSLPFLLVLS